MISEQNTEHNLNLLAAYRRLYSDAKRIRNIKVFISIALVVAALTKDYFPNYKDLLPLAGVVWIAVMFFVKDAIRKKVKAAATIQEEFDTTVFQLPWNEILVGDQVENEVVQEAISRYKNRWKELRDWYSDADKLPYPRSVLINQKCNMSWDWRLKRICAWFNAALIIAVGITVLYVGADQKLKDVLLNLFVPVFPALYMGVEAFSTFYRVSGDQERMAKKAQKLLDDSVNDSTAVTIEKCRQIQDFIFLIRSKDTLVPNLIYKINQQKYQKIMDAVIKLYKKKYHK